MLSAEGGQPTVFCEKDSPHATGTEFRGDLVVSDCLSDHLTSFVLGDKLVSQPVDWLSAVFDFVTIILLTGALC